MTLDLSTVNGSLTTAGVFVIPLEVGEENLDADFGVVVDDLPFTGFDFARLGIIAISLLLLGAGLVTSARQRFRRPTSGTG